MYTPPSPCWTDWDITPWQKAFEEKPSNKKAFLFHCIRVLLSLIQQCMTCIETGTSIMENTTNTQSKYSIVNNYTFMAFVKEHAEEDISQGREIGDYKDKQGREFKCLKLTRDGVRTFVSLAKKVFGDTKDKTVQEIGQILKSQAKDLQVLQLQDAEGRTFYSLCNGKDSHAQAVDLGF